MGMKQILLMIAVVVLVGQSVLAADKKPLIADPIVEKAIRKELKKRTGKLTKADLGKVVELNLIYAKVTDEGLKEVTKLKNLERLDLNYTRITDAGLQDLGELKNLSTLTLYGTFATEAAMSELGNTLPNCSIFPGY